MTNQPAYYILEPLLEDPNIMEIMIDGYAHVYVERRGIIEQVATPFHNEDHLLEVIQSIAAPLGREVNESHPILDLRLEDGSRVHVVISPISMSGHAMVIRKFFHHTITWDNLLSYGSLNEDMLEFIRACLLSNLNIVVAGGTGSGKTTVLNLIAAMIPEEERILLLQTAGEIRLTQPRVLMLETRPPNVEGRGEITMRQLVQSAMKMRPDRMVVTEVHGGEVLDLMSAMTTGFEGTLFSIHAVTPRDALARLEVMALFADPNIPLLNIRTMLGSAVNLILQQERLRDGSRKIVKITEVLGFQGDSVATQDIFEFRQTGMQDGKIQGHYTATGQIPRFLNRLRESGIELPIQKIFTPR